MCIVITKQARFALWRRGRFPRRLFSYRLLLFDTLFGHEGRMLPGLPAAVTLSRSFATGRWTQTAAACRPPRRLRPCPPSVLKGTFTAPVIYSKLIIENNIYLDSVIPYLEKNDFFPY